MRKLASIRKITAILPIEGADKIVCAVVDGWKVVVQKNHFAVGDFAVYYEIDSWVPHSLCPLLSKGKEPREYNGVKGERLKSIRLRGQLSQGLLIPINDVKAFLDIEELKEEQDVTDQLGIQKYDVETGTNMGPCEKKSNFPSFVRKTDQDRVQNLVKIIRNACDAGYLFEVTEKMEGSSMTCYLFEETFGVCSRNIDLVESKDNIFWAIARKLNIEELMRRQQFGSDFAIQGELIGPKISGNIYKLEEFQFHVFDIFNIREGNYVLPEVRRQIVKEMGLTHVPVLFTEKDLGSGSVDELLEFSNGKSQLAEVLREGVVFKQTNGHLTFKAISNDYLLGVKYKK